jgi:hypothetical protein
VTATDESLSDAFLPTFDVSDAVAVVVESDRATAWNALMNVDLLELGRRAPLVGLLGAIRMLPELVVNLVHGEAPPDSPKKLKLRELHQLPQAKGGWILLECAPASSRSASSESSGAP